jgi:hypothetical protein
VAFTDEGVLIRASSAGPELHFSAAHWADFVEAIKRGHFRRQDLRRPNDCAA